MDPILFQDNLPSRKQRLRDIDTETGDLFAPLPAASGSTTSEEAARAASVQTRAKRMLDVHHVITSAGVEGLARFEIAQALGVPEHWITSTIDRLLKVHREIVELSRTHYNPVSGRHCAVLIDKRFLSQQKESAA